MNHKNQQTATGVLSLGVLSVFGRFAAFWFDF